MEELIKEIMKFLEDFVVMDENYIRKNLNRMEYIEKYLEKNKIDYHTIEFFVPVPDFKEYYLYADGEKIRVLPDGLESGKVELNIKDSIDLEVNYSYPNINFSSKCESISTPNFYRVPALAISKKDLPKVLNAKDIDGYLKVHIKDVKNKVFIFGNIENPKRIGIIHYDALWTGAIDNSLSVASILTMIKNNMINLKDNMIILFGFEEISFYYDYWIYSSRRIIENFEFMPEKENIIIDSFGYRKTLLIDLRNKKPETFAEKVVYEVYRIFGEKIAQITVTQDDLFPIYHSDIDTIDKVDIKETEVGLRYIKELLG
ncbi:hypothetical protein YN1_5090 [Nanoarchaeota archaeon]